MLEPAGFKRYRILSDRLWFRKIELYNLVAGIFADFGFFAYLIDYHDAKKNLI